MTEPSNIPDLAAFEARIRSLEEAIAFQSHEADQLREHYLALTKALEACERRIAVLELVQRSSAEQPDDQA